MKRRASSKLTTLLLIGLSGAECSSPEDPSPAPPPAATRDGRFIQDIEALAKDLPRLHPNLFFKTSREAFEREVQALKTRVAEMRDSEVVTGLVRLAAIPGDAHTAIYPFSYTGFRRLPSPGAIPFGRSDGDFGGHRRRGASRRKDRTDRRARRWRGG